MPGCRAGYPASPFSRVPASPQSYTLSLHDALPICSCITGACAPSPRPREAPAWNSRGTRHPPTRAERSEEHTSELQSLAYLVCRLLLEKKKQAVEVWPRRLRLVASHEQHTVHALLG